MRGLSAVIGVMMALNGCGEEGAQVAANAAVADIPVAVQQAIDMPFPADGEIHIQIRGAFEIKPDTWFCSRRGGFGVDGMMLRTALQKLGQSDYFNGSPRGNGIVGESPGCMGGNPMFLVGLKSPNRGGKPYKLILAAWQGDVAKGGAFWIGGIERVEDGPRPNIFNPYGTDPKTFEIGADIKLISEIFTSQIGVT